MSPIPEKYFSNSIDWLSVNDDPFLSYVVHVFVLTFNSLLPMITSLYSWLADIVWRLENSALVVTFLHRECLCILSVDIPTNSKGRQPEILSNSYLYILSWKHFFSKLVKLAKYWYGWRVFSKNNVCMSALYIDLV